ncbi:plasmid mobilization relaxosome protein MobC [Streptomyces specialis]|uniref:plasmid mobilization relaxosome protein MobC n=1 Tax=Streptomyces specialis TaxID=498367 RepID=UPI0018FE3A25
MSRPTISATSSLSARSAAVTRGSRRARPDAPSSRVGNNINQIARIHNCTSRALPARSRPGSAPRGACLRRCRRVR